MVLKLKKFLLIMLAAAFLFVIFSVPVLAASSVVDIRQSSGIFSSGNSYPMKVEYVNDFYLAPDAVWYSPESYMSDFEIHFPLGFQLESGDNYTLTYDIYFGDGFNSNSQVIFSGLAENYLAATGSWISTQWGLFFHCTGSVTASASSSTDNLVLIPRGLRSECAIVAVNVLTISVADKDYTANIDNAANDIKNNADKNSSDIQANQDKNTDKTLNEDYGYQSPDSSTTDEGISSGTSLVESLNVWIDEFNAELPTTVSRILEAIEPVKAMVHKIFNVFPAVLQYLVTFAMVFLVLRKVIGR